MVGAVNASYGSDHNDQEIQVLNIVDVIAKKISVGDNFS